jgi:hypothetical protein
MAFTSSCCLHEEDCFDETSMNCTQCGMCIGQGVVMDAETTNYTTSASAGCPATLTTRLKKLKAKLLIDSRAIYIGGSDMDADNDNTKISPPANKKKRHRTSSFVVMASSAGFARNETFCAEKDLKLTQQQPSTTTSDALRKRKTASVPTTKKRKKVLKKEETTIKVNTTPAHAIKPRQRKDADRSLYLAMVAERVFPQHCCIATTGYSAEHDGSPTTCCPALKDMLSKHTHEKDFELMNFLTNLNERIVKQGVRDFVARMRAHFEMPQRRRLDHVSLFVAILGAHIDIVHHCRCSEGEEGEKEEEEEKKIQECLEFDRIVSKLKPSQIRKDPHPSRSALVLNVSELIGLKSAAATRLTVEVLELFGLIRPQKMIDLLRKSADKKKKVPPRRGSNPQPSD